MRITLNLRSYIFAWRLLSRSFTKFTSRYHIQNPSEAMRRSTAINTQFMDEIEQYLTQRGICDHMEITGSTYDGLNIDEDNNIRLSLSDVQSGSE